MRTEHARRIYDHQYIEHGPQTNVRLLIRTFTNGLFVFIVGTHTSPTSIVFNEQLDFGSRGISRRRTAKLIGIVS